MKIKAIFFSLFLFLVQLDAQDYPQENIYHIQNENPNQWLPPSPVEQIPKNLTSPNSSINPNPINPQPTNGYAIPNRPMNPVSSTAQFPHNPVNYSGYNSNRGDEENLMYQQPY